ncbi:helix-hairpin-helix domain-containing protein [Enterococcus sp. LJL99]
MDYKEWVKKYKKYLLVGLVVMVSILVSLLAFYYQKLTINDADNLEVIKNSSQGQSSEMVTGSTPLLYADVKGAVKKPGIYQIDEEMRVWDVVQLAGGVQEKADTKNVNFAEKVSDQMVIYIPNEGEVVELDQETTSEKMKQSNKVNLNTADETELQTLTGIGQKKAQEIIAYREENGGFKAIDELKNISGIGDKTFEKLKESISVS